MFFAVIASGVMIALALPPSGLWIFGWIALAPVFWATQNTRLSFGVISAIAASMVAAYVSVNGWVYRSGSATGEPMWTYLGFAIFGFTFAIVAGLSAEAKKHSLSALAVAASVGVLMELLTLYKLPAPLELSQAKVMPMLLLASITGIWGIGFLLWFFNLALASVLLGNKKLLPVVVTLVTAFVLVSFGAKFIPKGTELKIVGAVQSETIERSAFLRLSRKAGSLNASLAVWPEFGGMVFAPNGITDKLCRIAAEEGMPPFVTSFRDRFSPLPHNTAELFTKGGESEPYFKRKLFGAETNMHAPGSKAVVVPWLSSRLGLNICFDSCTHRLSGIPPPWMPI